MYLVLRSHAVLHCRAQYLVLEILVGLRSLKAADRKPLAQRLEKADLSTARIDGQQK